MRKKGYLTAAVLSLALMLGGCSSSTAQSETTTENVTTTAEATTTVAPTTTEAPTTEEPTTEAKAESPVNYYGELIVKDGKICGSKTGDVARVTGMSFFWSNWSQKFYTAEMVDKMVDEFGCEVLRCSYGIQDNGVPYDVSCEPLIEDVIEECIEKGVYVLVDWHSHGAHKNPEESAKYFGQLAEKYGSYDNVIFELFNEPTQIKWSEVKEYAETVIPAIREHSDNLILVGTPQWCQKPEEPAADPIDDPNLAYTLHFYAGTHTQWLRDSADRAMDKGIALFISEWGSVNADGNGAIAKQSTEDWFKWIDEKQLSSCNWAINDKKEGSSIFEENGEYTETGKYIMDLIQARTKNSPWK